MFVQIGKIFSLADNCKMTMRAHQKKWDDLRLILIDYIQRKKTMTKKFLFMVYCKILVLSLWTDNV